MHSPLAAGRTRRFILAALAVTAMAIPVSTASAATSAAGSVNFMRAAEGSFDTFTSNPTAAQQDWMKAHYSRMRAYAPYFDTRLSWSSKAWFYQSAYAIYPGSALDVEHPEWILRDAAGNKLYIPFGCSGGKCTQYAADIGNPASASGGSIRPAPARQGLRRHLHRRRQPLPQGLQRPRAGRRSDRPAHRRRDERADVAALPRRPHAGRPHRVPDDRDRPQLDLVRRRHHRRPAPHAPRRELHQPRARRQRRRPHRRHGQVELPGAAGLHRPPPRRGPRGRPRRHLDDGRRPPLRARRLLPDLLRPRPTRQQPGRHADGLVDGL